MTAVKQGIKDLGVAAVKNEHRYARLGNYLGGVELGYHSARASVSTSSARDGIKLVGYSVHLAYQLCVGVLSGVGIIKSVNVGHIYQKVSVADLRYVSRKDIVSAELCELVGRYSVVFVYYRILSVIQLC